MFTRRLAAVWLCILVPMTAAGLSGGPDGAVPHVPFHLVYIPIILLTLWPLLRLRGAFRGAPRVLATIVAIVYPFAAIGQVGETIVAVDHGGMHPSAEVFEDPGHITAALIGIIGMFATLLVMAVLSAIAGIRMLRSGTRVGWIVLLPAVVFPLEMVVAASGFTPSQALAGTTLSAVVLGVGAFRSAPEPSMQQSTAAVTS